MASTSMVLRFSQMSSGGWIRVARLPAASSSFLMRSAVLVRARWSLSSSLRRDKTSKLESRAERLSRTYAKCEPS